MHIDYKRFYEKHPKLTLSDILYKNKYQHIHNNYISFAENILSHNFKTTTTQSNQYQMNAINKVIRILALDVQNNLLNHALSASGASYYSPIFSYNPPICPKCGKLNQCSIQITILNSSVPFDIAKQPTISFPWNTNRLMNALGMISDSVTNPFVWLNDRIPGKQINWNNFRNRTFAFKA